MIEDIGYQWGYIITDQDGNWDSDTVHVYQSHENPDQEVVLSLVSDNPPEDFVPNWGDLSKNVCCVGKVSYWKRNIKTRNVTDVSVY